MLLALTNVAILLVLYSASSLGLRSSLNLDSISSNRGSFISFATSILPIFLSIFPYLPEMLRYIALIKSRSVLSLTTLVAATVTSSGVPPAPSVRTSLTSLE